MTIQTPYMTAHAPREFLINKREATEKWTKVMENYDQGEYSEKDEGIIRKLEVKDLSIIQVKQTGRRKSSFQARR